jgi:hypothetical protein
VLYAADPEKAAPIIGKFPTLRETASRPSFDNPIHVVRLDGYVGLTTGADDWNPVERYLKELA